MNWAKVRVTRAAMTDRFIEHAVFLLGERQRDKSGGEEASLGTGESGERARSNPQLNVPETKDRTQTVRRGDAQIFAGAKEKIEAKDKAVSGRHRSRRSFGFYGRVDSRDDGER